MRFFDFTKPKRENKKGTSKKIDQYCLKWVLMDNKTCEKFEAITHISSPFDSKEDAEKAAVNLLRTIITYKNINNPKRKQPYLIVRDTNNQNLKFSVRPEEIVTIHPVPYKQIRV